MSRLEALDSGVCAGHDSSWLPGGRGGSDSREVPGHISKGLEWFKKTQGKDGIVERRRAKPRLP